MSTRRNALVLLLLPALLLVYACRDQVTGTDLNSTSLALRIVLGAEVQALNVDQGIVRIRGRTTKDESITPGTEKTISGLLPGSYIIALEGMDNGEVVVFAQRSGVSVSAGQTTDVTLTPQSFVPVLQGLPAAVGVGENFQVSFSSVTGATGYTVEIANNPGFTNLHEYSTTTSPVTVFLDGVGDSYVRVRARNIYTSTGQASPSVTVTAEPSTSVCTAQSEMAVEDCEALVALYESTDGPNWVNSENWLATTAPCNWYGVGCPDGSFVTLDLASNQLNGPIPTELGNLANLEELYVSGNNLTGDLPPELGNLSNLRVLELSGNQLTGTVPPRLGDLSALIYLTLSGNQLDGQIPPQLGNLQNLEHFYLDWNQFSGDIQPELGNLQNLKVLRLNQNQLTGGIPTELTNLTSLEELSLQENDLSGSIPAELGNLTGLQFLILQSNRLTGNIPIELGNLSNLKDLKLDKNQFSGDIPPELGNLQNLVELGLWNNQLAGGIPAALGNLSSLEFLDLDRNQLTGGIPTELGSLASLESLYLSRNQLTGSIPSELGNLSNLRIMYLSGNELTGAIPPELGDLTNLELMYLSWNQLTGNIPPELGSLPNIRFLGLGPNQLTGSIPPELGNLSSLERLYLNENQLTGSIPSELGQLSSLVRLTLNWNQLTGSIPTGIGQLANLERLQLFGNGLSGQVPLEVVQTGGRIQDAYGGDQCTFLPPGNETLFMPDNQDYRDADGDGDGRVCGLGFVPSLCQSQSEIPVEECSALAALYESTNGPNWTNNTGWLTTETPCSWFGVTCSGGSVSGLDLHSNQLNGPFPHELGNLPALEGLILFDNQLTGQIPSALGNLWNLERLNLNSNQLEGSIPWELGNLSNLIALYLYGNQLTDQVPLEVAQNGGRIQDLYGDSRCSFTPPGNEGLFLDESPGLRAADVDGDGSICGVGFFPGICLAQSEISVSECTGLAALYTSTDGPNWTNNDGWMATGTPCSWHGVTCAEGSVSVLDLDDNQLTGTIPPEIGDLAGLQDLNLFDNQLSGTIPPEIGSLTSLSRLTLGYNDLTGTIPSEMGNLQSLTYLLLVRTQISGSIPPEIGNLANLDYLGLWNNQLSGAIPPELGYLSKLKTLAIRENQFTGTIPPELGNLPSLESLGLAWNQLTGGIPTQLGQLSNLDFIDLGQNQLTGSIPSELGNLTGLSTLSLSNNQLTGGIPAEFGNIADLSYLTLRGNQLSGSIPAELGNLSNLSYLYLEDNQLSGPLPLEVAQNGGRIQNEWGTARCLLKPPGNDGLSMSDTPDFRAADLDVDGLICGVSFSGTVPTLLAEDFNDGDYTGNPTWTTYTPGGGNRTIEVVSGELHIERFNAGGEGRWTRLETPVNIFVNSTTAIQFDVKVVSSSVVGGCGSACTEFPVNVVLELEAADGRTHSVYYAYNNDGGYSQTTSGPTHVNHYVARGDAPTGVWLRGERKRVRDIVPDATRIYQVRIGGVGWDYDGWYDNISIGDNYPPDPSNKLAAHYPLDGDGEDVSGNAHHATVYGAAPATDRFGTAGTALSFDGADDHLLVAHPVPSSLDVTEPTITAWVKLDQTAPTNLYKIVNRQEAEASFQQYGLNVRYGLPSFGSTTGTAGARADGPNALQAGRWCFLAGTNDGTTLRIYVNGQLANTETSAGAQYGPIAGPLAMGRAWRDAWHVPGTIDDVRIYDRALSAAEIAALCDVAAVCGGSP